MDESQRIKRFNQELEAILNGGALARDLTEEDQRALETARFLAGVDFSLQSHIRQSLRQRLERQIGYQSFKATIGFSMEGWSAITGGKALSWLSKFPGALLVALLVLLFGLMLTETIAPRIRDSAAATTAFVAPVNSLPLAVPTSLDGTADNRTLTPTPIALPLAPQEFHSGTLATVGWQDSPPSFSYTSTPSLPTLSTP